MADLSYLDTISNKELHKKCLEYGLPNIPVADSSRQVILKRLKSAILGVPVNKKATAAKKTPRRETIHGSKVTPSPAAAAIETSNVKRTANRNSNNSISSRRTIGTVPSFDNSETSSVRTVHTTTTVSDVDSQSEEDDNYNSIYRQNEQYSQIKQTAPRRSVSLSKSGVLTTSYTREVDPLEQEPRDSDIDAPQSHTYERPRAAAAHMLPSYEPAIERSTYRPRYAGLPKIQPLAQTQLNSTSYFDDGGYELPEHNVPRNTFSGSSAPFGHGSTLGSSIRQRQTGGSSNLGGSIARGALLLPTTKIRGLYSQPETTKPNTLYPELNEFYDNRNPDTVEPMDTDSDSDGN
ncbi:LEM domain-containing protein Bocksbeutel-like isoform X2 [Scaptodrosophila lebanonensis]|uniref:LEM domain-containing protein Bocksbeutel-like isoform X2 n=1 Tax=Drosophila lebanonensis TaxID=7225 RepID=A0A6J2TG63_DROLE|nr:LEM domain-containing protein Bocksbeutel-like isoform X2 [Scaptodrosophila lebanonensis]